jgi:glycosyltransferase involved in cell wall biosynthesis
MLPSGFTLLQVTPALDAGGVEALTVDVATAAAAAGARSLVVSRGGRLEGALAFGGGELIRLPIQARDPVSLFANVGRLEEVIRREKVSLVHVRSRAPAFSALRAARRAGVPSVTTYHGIYAAASPLKRWYNSVMTRGDAVIANSAYTRDHVLAQHRVRPGRLVVIPEGIDLALARSAARDTARLVFAGGGETGAYATALAADARAAGVELRLAGPCADMPAAYLAADLVAAPSTEPESFGRAVAEAGAMERVALASALGGPAETIVDGETGWLVTAGDVAAWTAAIERALDVSLLAHAAMGAAARARIAGTYSFAHMCEATFALYSRLTEPR